MRVSRGCVLVAVVALHGCALVHERPTDAGPPIDAYVPFDGGHDAAIVPLPDVGPHGTCHVDPRPRAGFGTPRSSTRELAAGYFADIVVAPSAPAGTYELHAASGIVSLTQGGTTVGTAPYDPSAPYGDPCFPPTGTVLHYEGYVDVTLCDPGGPGASTLVGLPAMLESTNPLVIDPPAVITTGLECRDYIVDWIDLAPSIAPGDYTFVSSLPTYTLDFSGNLEVIAYRDGEPVGRAAYDWHQFPPFDFVFPGLFTIHVSTNVGGNLYSIHDSFFEGRSVMRVVCDP